MEWNGQFSGHAYCFNAMKKPCYSWKRGQMEVSATQEKGSQKFVFVCDDQEIIFSGKINQDCFESQLFSNHQIVRVKLIGGNNEITGKISLMPVVLEEQMTNMWEVQLHLFKN